MIRPLLCALVAVAACVTLTTESAYAGHKHRQERRQAILAGAVREGIAEERAEERYEECMIDSHYDEDCERRLRKDMHKARAKGRRTAVIVGSIN